LEWLKQHLFLLRGPENSLLELGWSIQILI
jgi:hypothetical protein